MRNIEMKNLLKIIIVCLTINSAYAAKLEDVVILDVKQSKDSVELKLHVTKGPKDSYFLVDLVKSDKNSFDKMALVLRKLKDKDDFKLGLDIQSFSMSPSGSYYRSDSVTFLGNILGESFIVH
jgi:hypothetical protein